MWELIAQNRRRSWLLFLLMGAILLALGYTIGAAYAPPNGGVGGIVIAGMVWLVLSLISYFGGSSIVLNSVGAKEVTPDIHPQLFNVVEEMKIAAALPKMPKVYMIDSPALNAFATGMKPEESSVAVTAGLLSKLNRDELQGVVAHETGHIVNRDVQFVTFAGVMLGAIVIISEVFLRGMFYSSRGRRVGSSRGKNGGQGAAIVAIVAIALAILAPIMARLLYFAISRRREYLADATAVRLTRYPEGLASALEKIAGSTDDLPKVNKAVAPMFIANPLKKAGARLSDLTSTHPPISERIRILRSIAGGSGYLEYQSAYNQVRGKGEQILPVSALDQKEAVPLRKAVAEEKASQASHQRSVNDLARAVNGFLFLNCSCGLKMKIPPGFAKKTVTCPRCGTVNSIPVAELAAIGAALEAQAGGTSAVSAIAADPNAQSYQRTGKGWESFRCGCGRTLQISPAFVGDNLVCSSCGRVTKIKPFGGV